MCLGLVLDHPDRILARGEFCGFEWIVTHNDMGYRCGYVKLPPNHPWFNMEMERIDVSIHGGITFAEKDVPCGKGGPDDGYWIGFDCAHFGDLPDPELPNGGNIPLLPPISYGTVKSQKYAESECFSLCEQAKLAAKPV